MIRVSGRYLYDNNVISFKLRTNFFILGNNLPKFKNVELGLLRRVKTVDFSQKFVERPIGENEKLLDLRMKEKIKKEKKIYPAFMNILLSMLNRTDIECLKKWENMVENFNVSERTFFK